MKILSFTLLILTTQANVFQYDCGLSVSLSTLKYVMVTRSMEMKVRLSSNCMNLRDFHLEVAFNFQNRLSQKHHPKKLELDILGNSFIFEFKSTQIKDQNSILRNLEYTKARITAGGGNAHWRDISVPNSFLLE